MFKSDAQLREDAEKIWRAGVAAVSPSQLIPAHVAVRGRKLLIGDQQVSLNDVARIVIIGAGKASGAMAVALEKVLGPTLIAEKNVMGWVNVPADCIVPTTKVHLHAARPAGINEPRPEGIVGTKQILKLVSELNDHDLCICLLSGGGSALLPAPVDGIELEDKLQLTRLMSAAGADIGELNTVRQCISRVKGGGLARACRAGQLISLIISDVLGDRLDWIASGPTVDVQPSAAKALECLRNRELHDEPALWRIVEYLSQNPHIGNGPVKARVSNIVLANNASAVDAAGVMAEQLGYSHAMVSATAPEGAAEAVGAQLAKMALRMRDEKGPDCLISGGEPTVQLADLPVRGKGGRNQQLALAAVSGLGDCRGITLLSAGTDGEDGPTDAAGAFVTESVVREAKRQRLSAAEHLRRNDAYHYFERAGGLFRTGPTQTNVCDLRVITVSRGAD